MFAIGGAFLSARFAALTISVFVGRVNEILAGVLIVLAAPNNSSISSPSSSLGVT